MMKLAPPETAECYKEFVYPRYEHRELSSDALIGKSSQIGEASRWTKSNTEIVRALGANQLEMNKHPSCEDILRKR